VDYRKLNDVTKKGCSPLPWIDDTLDMVAGAKWISTLESRYWQVDVQPNNEKKAFSKGPGLWQFTVMLSFLCNAPATFETLMETVLQALTYDSCLVYLDNVIVIGHTFQGHLLNLRKVFQQFQEACLKLYPEKCQLLQK
jgi:hypothetical protein